VRESARAVCSFCRKAFEREDEQIVHYAHGEVAGVYHDWCRPDRRRSGCGASAC